MLKVIELGYVFIVVMNCFGMSGENYSGSGLPRLMSLADYFTNPQPCDAVERVQAQYREERRENLIDPVALREAQDWSELGGRVVGAEGF